MATKVKNTISNMPRKATKLTSRFVKFDGKLAQAWLEHDKMIREKVKRKNRPLTPSNVKKKMADMCEDCFVTTSQGPTVDQDTAVIDGQHTLHAVVAYYEKMGLEARPIELYITEGEDPTNFPFYDQGKNRSTADVLSIDNHTDPTELAIALRLLWIRYNGFRVSGAPRTSPYVLQEFLKEFKGLEKSLKYIMSFGKDEDSLPCRDLMSPGYAAALHFLMANADDVDADRADSFWKEIIEQRADKKNSPAEKFYRGIRKIKSDPNLRMDRDGLVNTVIKAFNMYVDGETGSITPTKGEKPELGGYDGAAAVDFETESE